MSVTNLHPSVRGSGRPCRPSRPRSSRTRRERPGPHGPRTRSTYRARALSSQRFLESTPAAQPSFLDGTPSARRASSPRGPQSAPTAERRHHTQIITGVCTGRSSRPCYSLLTPSIGQRDAETARYDRPRKPASSGARAHRARQANLDGPGRARVEVRDAYREIRRFDERTARHEQRIRAGRTKVARDLVDRDQLGGEIVRSRRFLRSRSAGPRRAIVRPLVIQQTS